MTGVQDGMPLLDDGTVVTVTNVVWSTGFRQIFDWIKLPILASTAGRVEFRGVVDEVPGLFFCGLAFQYAFSLDGLPGHRPRRRVRARGSSPGRPATHRCHGRHAVLCSPAR